MRDFAVRRERLAEAIREVLSQLLVREIKDPRLKGVVISAVELAGDLKLARAYFSVLGDAERERQASDAFKQAAGFLQHEVSRQLRLHNAPALEFRRDKGFERADRVQRILDEITGHREPGTGRPEDEDGDRRAGSGESKDKELTRSERSDPLGTEPGAGSREPGERQDG